VLKKKQAYKPDSVFRRSEIFVIDLGHPSPDASSCQPPDAGELPLDVGILGISTREVYPATFVAESAVGSYPTISPLPRKRGGIFSVALAVRLFQDALPVRKHGALCCPDFPLRLSTQRRSGLLGAKLGLFGVAARDPPPQPSRSLSASDEYSEG